MAAQPPATGLQLRQFRDCAGFDGDLVMLQTGFGHGDAFLGAWHRWRECGASGGLHFIATAADAPDAATLRARHRHTPFAAQAAALADAWPPLTPDLHRIDFEAGGRVSLLLAIGPASRWLPELQARVNLFVIDDFDAAYDPQRWAQRLCRALARLAAPEARLSTLLPAETLTPALRSAGFEVENAGDGEPLRARYRPGFRPRRIAVPPSPTTDRHALIVGAGLAGCAAAWALARVGWRSTVIDGHGRVAAEASGNVAGLFHGSVNPQDGAHARFNRVAAVTTQGVLAAAAHDGRVVGGMQGLLRIQAGGIDAAAMRSQLARLQLPGDYVQALDAAQASALAGVELDHPAWYYPGGGWLRPAALAQHFLAVAGDLAQLDRPARVQRIIFRGGLWELFDAAGRVIRSAATLVLANAFDALRLGGCAHWPVRPVRGQLSLYPHAALPAGQRATLPRIALAGDGYVLPEVDGMAVFGASAHEGDDESEARRCDHLWNLQRLNRLCAQAAPLAVERLRGRVGWRCVSSDRLPIVGAMPDERATVQSASAGAAAVPRQAGLYLFTALGSRGIVWSAIAARQLAADISGTPAPLPRSLASRIDPARFVLRAQHAAARHDQAEG